MATNIMMVRNITRTSACRKSDAVIKNSSVAAAAYRSGEALKDEATGKTHRYNNRDDINASFILAPADAPDWVQDRKTLWNMAETAEKRKDSRLFREVLLPLPRELDLEQNVRLVIGWVNKEFATKGLIADISWHGHKENHNPHAHIMLTTRKAEANGFAAKKADGWNSHQAYKNEFGSHEYFSDVPDHIKDQDKLVAAWRISITHAVNNALDDAGFDIRVDYMRQTNFETYSISRDALAMEERGIETEEGNKAVIEDEIIAGLEQTETFKEQLFEAGHTETSFWASVANWWTEKKDALAKGYSDIASSLEDGSGRLIAKFADWFSPFKTADPEASQGQGRGESQ